MSPSAIITLDYEETISFVNPADLTDAAVLSLKTFLLQFGREAQQGEVGVVFDGVYYGFTRF